MTRYSQSHTFKSYCSEQLFSSRSKPKNANKIPLFHRVEKSAYVWASMGWFLKGAVQHRRYRIFPTPSHFGRFWRAFSRDRSKMIDSLLGIERFSWSRRQWHAKTCDIREGFWPPPSSMLILMGILLFQFRPPRPSLLNVGKPARKNGSNLASKSTLMREGAAKSDKFLIFWHVLGAAL